MELDGGPIPYLLGGYFHEDWIDEFRTWEEVIDDFVARDRSKAEATPPALRTLLASHDEEHLKALFGDEPWDFSAMSDDGTYAGWFRQLLEHLESQLHTHSQEQR